MTTPDPSPDMVERIRYFVVTDGPALSANQTAQLYRATGRRCWVELVGTGTVEQMQRLADELNGAEDRR